MHALGFQNEQSRTDRDDFVVVDFSKITPGKFITVYFPVDTQHRFNVYKTSIRRRLHVSSCKIW